MRFKLHSDFKPSGDQPQAIEALVKGLELGLGYQVLLGVTGSGKTFTMANVIEKIQKPTLVISHNKTLAAQLFQEFREFFPDNAVEYFVSYYDYYQPEAYIPQTDTYIEKDVDINEEIEKLRLSTTTSLLTRSDVLVVASVSCIYNLGSPVEYGKAIIEVKKGEENSREEFLRKLISLFYERGEYEFKRGTFRVRGEVVDVFPAYSDLSIRVEFRGDRIARVGKLDPLTGEELELVEADVIYPAKHYITAQERYGTAFRQIRADLEKQVAEFKKKGKDLEAHRLVSRTNYDLEMIREIGYCKGIENYSRYFDGRVPGDPPYTLLDYFGARPTKQDSPRNGGSYFGARPTKQDSPRNGGSYFDGFLTFIDESHMTIPQLRGMYRGDKSRKETLIDYGFRLPAAIDNRPLKFGEFLERINQAIYVSATPDAWEIEKSSGWVVEQLIRPTGLLDPEIEIRPTLGQIENLMGEIGERVGRKERILVTTLTKRMAEDLSSYLEERGIKVHYLHSDIETLIRTDILEDLRRGKYDVVVGINLLREGLDLPEVSLVAILDADKEGFLRSETSLIQTMGRAARHVRGKVIMYADSITGSMRRAIKEVERRRKVQERYNLEHGIVPQTIEKPIRGKIVEEEEKKGDRALDIKVENLSPRESQRLLKDLSMKMGEAAEVLDFEIAAKYRDKIRELKRTL